MWNIVHGALWHVARVLYFPISYFAFRFPFAAVERKLCDVPSSASSLHSLVNTLAKTEKNFELKKNCKIVGQEKKISARRIFYQVWL